MKIAGVILMGGKARRLNGVQKTHLQIGNTSCFERVVSRLEGNVEEIALSLASEDQLFATKAQYSVIYDDLKRPKLEGIPAALLSIMNWAQLNLFDQVITTTGDTPFLPEAYVSELTERISHDVIIDAPIVSVSNGRIHGLHALWPLASLSKLKWMLTGDTCPSMSEIHAQLGSSHHHFAVTSHDPFMNINTQRDYSIARNLAETHTL